MQDSCRRGYRPRVVDEELDRMLTGLPESGTYAPENDLREVDLIVERQGGVLGIEVKLAAVPSRQDTANLRWLARRMGTELLDMVIVTTGRHAYRDRDGVAVVPAALLGP